MRESEREKLSARESQRERKRKIDTVGYRITDSLRKRTTEENIMSAR